MTSAVTAAGTVTFYKPSPHHIHVFTRNKREAVINSIEQISCLCVEVVHPDTEDPCGVWALWMGSVTGRVYCVHNLCLQTSRHKDKSFDNEDIFDTLLDSELPSQGREESEQALNIVRVIPSLSKLQLSAPVVSICTGQGLLCVCTETNNIAGKSYTLSLYNTKSLSARKSNSEHMVPVWTRHVLGEGLEYMGYRTKENANNPEPLPVVYLVSPSTLRPSDVEDSGCPTELFSALFGSESTFMDAKVLIFGSPSGVTFCFKLKNLHPEDKPEVLCNLNQPVIAVRTFAVPCNGRGETAATNSSFQGYSQSENQLPVVCMAVIGQNGKCLLIFQANDTLQYQTVIMPGPIVSVCALTGVMYISTHKDLHRCRLSLFEREDRKKKFTVSLSSLGFCGINGIFAELGSTLGSVQLCLFSRHGRLYTLTDEGQRREDKTVAATQMKDLLLSIGNTSDEMDRVKEMISAQNDVLSQLSFATKLASLTSGTAAEKATKVRKLKEIVKVKVCVKQDCLGSVREFSILVKLTNESLVELSSDWLIMVQVDHLQDIKGEITVSNFSKSLPLLNGLGPESYEEIQIPLEGKQLKIPLFAVTAFLVYNVPEVGFNKVVTKKADHLVTRCLSSSSEGDTSALCIPLQQEKLNILDFLHVPGLCHREISQLSHRSHYSLATSEMCSFEEIALELAIQRPAYGLYSHRKDSHTQRAIRSLTINLQGSEAPLLKECKNSGEVLNMLLSLTALESAVKGETTHCRVSTPRGYQVTLRVNSDQSQLSDTSMVDQSEASSHKTSYTLTLQSKDLLTLVLLRSGFTEKLSHEKTTDDREEGDVQEKQVRSLLNVYQGIRKDIESLEVSRVTENGSENKDVFGEYGALYEQLRNAPLCHVIPNTPGELRRQANQEERVSDYQADSSARGAL